MGRVLVGLSASDAFYGKAIRKLTDSRWNHAFILYESALWGGWWIVQVDEDGVHKLPASKLLNGYTDTIFFEHVSGSGDVLAPGLQENRDYIGAKYDWLGIIGFALKAGLWKLTGLDIVNPLQNKAKLFCSELAMKILKDSWITGTEDIEPSSTDPESLYQFVCDSEQFRETENPLAP